MERTNCILHVTFAFMQVCKCFGVDCNQNIPNHAIELKEYDIVKFFLKLLSRNQVQDGHG
jgi:hypothetical protein